MRYGSIYVATNTVTGEQYVGQTRQRVERRWKCHVNTANSAVAKKYGLANAILQYGKDAIKFVEIYAAFDADELDAAEMNYIDWMKPAYNITKGGAGHRKADCSESVRQGRSERMKALWSDPEWKATQVEKLREIGQSESAKERGRKVRAIGTAARWANHVKKEKPVKNQSESIKTSWQDPAIREKRMLGIRAANLRPDVIAKRSQAKKGKKQSASQVAQIAKAKWKPIYCPELQVTFLSGIHAAQYFNVSTSNISQVVAREGKVKRLFTLLKVK